MAEYDKNRLAIYMPFVLVAMKTALRSQFLNDWALDRCQS